MHKWPVPSNTSGQFLLQHSATNSVLPNGYPGESYSFHGGGGSMRPPVPLPTMFSVSSYNITYFKSLLILKYRKKSAEISQSLIIISKSHKISMLQNNFYRGWIIVFKFS